MAGQADANKAVVREFYDLAFNKRKPEEAVAKYMGRTYRQHNPQAGDGPEAFIAFVKGFAQAFPSFRMDLKRMVAEGDLVAAHSHLIRSPGDRGVAVMDIFRLENGRVAEHWDVLQEVPEKAENANTMFYVGSRRDTGWRPASQRLSSPTGVALPRPARRVAHALKPARWSAMRCSGRTRSACPASATLFGIP